MVGAIDRSTRRCRTLRTWSRTRSVGPTSSVAMCSPPDVSSLCVLVEARGLLTAVLERTCARRGPPTHAEAHDGGRAALAAGGIIDGRAFAHCRPFTELAVV